jgi:hypothetical protein
MEKDTYVVSFTRSSGLSAFLMTGGRLRGSA